MNVIDGGVYFLEDQYYADFPDPYLKSNKGEARPFYYVFRDSKTGLLWMIPFSSQPRKIALAKKKASEGKTDIFHLTKLDGRDGVMLIADMCPVTEAYIKSEFHITGQHVVYKDTTEKGIILRKARKVLALLRRGVVFSPTQPNVLQIEAELMK